MAENSIQLPFAINSDGILVSIFDVNNGLGCDCTCPGCGATVIAKQQKRAWHFAHHDKSACKSGYETALHLAVKHIIFTEKKMNLPSCSVIRFNDNSYDYIAEESMLTVKKYCSDAEEIGFGFQEQMFCTFNDVYVEQADGDIRLDIVAVTDNGRYNIEVAVTHFVDATKLQKIRSKKNPTLEITISPKTSVINWETLTSLVVDGLENKQWIYNHFAERIADAAFLNRLDEIKKRQDDKENKKRIYELRYKPIHEVVFKKWKSNAKIYIKICPAHVSIKVFPFDSYLVGLVKTTASQCRGSYNSSQNQWEFSSNVDVFSNVAASIRKGDVDLHSFPNDELIMSGLGFGIQI